MVHLRKCLCIYMCKFPSYFTSLKLSPNGKKDKVRPSLYSQVNTVGLKYTSSIIMIQTIIEKGCLSFQWGEDGIQLDFSPALSSLNVHHLHMSQAYLHATCDTIHSKPNTLSRDFIWNKTGGKDWRRSRQILHIKLKGKLVANMRPWFPKVQTRGLKFGVLMATNACIEFQYLRHNTERFSYIKIEQIGNQYYVTNDWN